MERWSPLSHIFQFRGHEATILLEEVERLLGLDALSLDEAFIYTCHSSTSLDVIKEISGRAPHYKAKSMAVGDHAVLLGNVCACYFSLKQFLIPSDKTRYMRGVMIVLGDLFLFHARRGMVYADDAMLLLQVTRRKSIGMAALAHLYDAC